MFLLLLWELKEHIWIPPLGLSPNIQSLKAFSLRAVMSRAQFGTHISDVSGLRSVATCRRHIRWILEKVQTFLQASWTETVESNSDYIYTDLALKRDSDPDSDMMNVHEQQLSAGVPLSFSVAFCGLHEFH